IPPAIPHGLEAIIATYGDASAYCDRKDVWEVTALTMRPLPFPLPYAYAPDRTVGSVRAHHLIVGELVEAITECLDAHVPADRLVYGGCYCYRPKRASQETLSVHAWGIAVDLDPANNKQGKVWRDDGIMLDARILNIFERRGWDAGARWNHPDAMHLQWATG